jgi:hypothetical protein
VQPLLLVLGTALIAVRLNPRLGAFQHLIPSFTDIPYLPQLDDDVYHFDEN